MAWQLSKLKGPYGGGPRHIVFGWQRRRQWKLLIIYLCRWEGEKRRVFFQAFWPLWRPNFYIIEYPPLASRYWRCQGSSFQERKHWCVMYGCTFQNANCLFFQIYVACSIHLFSLAKFWPSYDQAARVPSLPIVIPIAQIGLMGSVYCTVALALERFLAVCYPFLPRRWVHILYQKTLICHNFVSWKNHGRTKSLIMQINLGWVSDRSVINFHFRYPCCQCCFRKQENARHFLLSFFGPEFSDCRDSWIFAILWKRGGGNWSENCCQNWRDKNVFEDKDLFQQGHFQSL